MVKHVKFSGRMPRVSLGTIGWILVLGFATYRMSPQVKAAFNLDSGEAVAPTFQLHTLNGDPVSLEAYRGKVVLVNFWATWCPPCRIEMPGFQNVYDDRRGDGFVVLGISTDRGGTGAVHDFLAEREITFPVAMATPEVVHDFGGVRALPTSFLIDRQGRIRQQVKGFFAEPALRLAVGRLLEEPLSDGPAGGSHD